ncbi:hypothetical protein [Desulforamulus aeronauticus]|uniref:hypothetical protein n=1 Tax=Desulforamulus aeronauticus TaxID=53343 RepID=UPI001EE3BDB1|nr:hypothetical protein [Desulforamulus aeronauticus]
MVQSAFVVIVLTCISQWIGYLLLLGKNITPFIVRIPVDNIAILVHNLGYVSVAVVQVVIVTIDFSCQGIVPPDGLCGNNATVVCLGDYSTFIVVMISGGASW